MLKKSHPASSLFLYLCTVLSLFITVTGLMSIHSLEQLIYQVAYLPVTFFLLLTSLLRLLGQSPRGIRILAYYNFIVVAAMVTSGWLSARSLPELLSAALFSPLAIYFFLQALPRRNHAIHLPKINQPEPLVPLVAKPFDFDRRAFLKLIGSAGISVFLFSLFTKRAEAAFFGGSPNTTPGTLSLKDTAGNKINPAEKSPTDGYSISQSDDSTPAYYGFINKLGQWFIMKEDSSGAYRYTRGDSYFSHNWTKRASLMYDYFDNVF